MDNTELLMACLKVTGSFENGTPSFESIAGDSDGEGISVGLLQWNAGQGTLQRLVTEIAAKMGWDKAKSFFASDIQQFASLPPAAALAFAKAHYLDGTKIAPAAEAAWRNFLSTPESQFVQLNVAESTTLAAAQKLAAKYMPEDATHSRVVAFFFDLINQEGSMSTVPVTTGQSGAAAIALADARDGVCAALWRIAVAGDALASQLLYYGFERAKLGRAAYVWDSLSRRGTIACRKGIVHKTPLDFTDLLD